MALCNLARSRTYFENSACSLPNEKMRLLFSKVVTQLFRSLEKTRQDQKVLFADVNLSGIVSRLAVP